MGRILFLRKALETLWRSSIRCNPCVTVVYISTNINAQQPRTILPMPAEAQEQNHNAQPWPRVFTTKVPQHWSYAAASPATWQRVWLLWPGVLPLQRQQHAKASQNTELDMMVQWLQRSYGVKPHNKNCFGRNVWRTLCSCHACHEMKAHTSLHTACCHFFWNEICSWSQMGVTWLNWKASCCHGRIIQLPFFLSRYKQVKRSHQRDTPKNRRPCLTVFSKTNCKP